MRAMEKESLVKELYEKYPYPSRNFTRAEELTYFAEWVAKIFGEGKAYWKGKEVLELGCGTGELANSLALCGAKVVAVDFSSSAIKKAKELSHRLGMEKNVKFYEKNILTLGEDDFADGEKLAGGKKFTGEKKFDAVIALGSLHHTINAKKGFEVAAYCLKNKGIIVIGLYNKYSRVRHRVKRFVIWTFCGADIEKRIAFGEKHFGYNKGKTSKAWAADKYGQTHESYHSISEVLKWFKENEINFAASKPKFKKPLIDEIKWLTKRENAFFVMVGEKAS